MMTTTARRRRSALVLPVLAVGALELAGCSGGEDGDGGAVTYWSQWEQGEPQAEILQEAIDDFTAETGIEVEVEIGRASCRERGESAEVGRRGEGEQEGMGQSGC